MTFLCDSIEDTQKVAKNLAKKTPPGSVIALIGELGAGKTTFTKGFAREMGVKDPVTSPTFKLVSEYKGKKYVKKNGKVYIYKKDGLRRRRKIRGNVISQDTRQINLKVVEVGKRTLGSIFGLEEDVSVEGLPSEEE